MVRGPHALAASLALLVACGDDPPPPAPPEPEVSSAPKGPPARGGETHTFGASAAGTSKAIHVGDRVLVDLEGAAQGISPELSFGWGTPELTGDAIRFVNREDKSPPPHIDGGRFTHIFELRAVRAGRSNLLIPVTDKGAKADATEYRVEFTVANPD